MPMPNFHACRLIDPEECEEGSWKTADAKFGGKPVQILYATHKKDGKRKRQAIHFPTKSWSEAEARRMCSGTFELAKDMDHDKKME